MRLPEESGSNFSLHRHQQLLNHPNLHLTSRWIGSASSGRGEASSVLPLSTVSGGSGSISGSYSRSTGVGLGRSVQRTPFGKVRQRTKRSEDGRWEQQGGVTGLGLTAHRPSTKTDRRSVDFVFDSEDTNPSRFYYHLLSFNRLRPCGLLHRRLLNRPRTAIAMPKGKIKEPTSTVGEESYIIFGFCFIGVRHA